MTEQRSTNAVRHLLRAHQIARTQVRNTHSDFLGEHLEETLQCECGFRLPSPAIGSHRGLVGADATHGNRDIRKPIGACDMRGGNFGGGYPTGENIGADIGRDLSFQCGETALLVAADLERDVHRARVRGRL